MDISLRSNRGFLSSTTSTFQFGILEKNQWAGEERLLKETNEQMGYSILAKTKVRAFAISKEDAKKKFTKEIMEFIVKMVDQRYSWIKNRAKALSQASANMAKMDPSNIKYDDSLAEMKKKYPTAAPYVLTTIRKKFISEKSTSSHKLVPNLQMASVHASIDTSLLKASHPATNRAKGGIMTNRTSISGDPNMSLPSALVFQNSFAKASMNSKYLDATAPPSTRVLPVAMSLATSASRLVGGAIYAPVFTGAITKKRNLSTGAQGFNLASRKGQTLYDEKLTAKLKAEMNQNNLNKFMVGKRVIKVLDDASGPRPITPNPFALLSGKLIVSSK